MKTGLFIKENNYFFRLFFKKYILNKPNNDLIISIKLTLLFPLTLSTKTVGLS